MSEKAVKTIIAITPYRPSNQWHSFPRTVNLQTFLLHFAVHWQFGGGPPWEPHGDSCCNEENQSKKL